MKLPRDVSGAQLIKALERLEYRVIRQIGSHVRLVCVACEEHHLTIPLHDPLRIGTLAAILTEVSVRHHLSKDELITRLFGNR
ncbi:MAG: type II toxin-antitoxin system HicA family toxin [Nitrosomonas sp.]|uniref:type II toxin-antitoxin system HicA family toxin n=1 Tax=Nitrosomonas sp. TaxID=42353 RepID=UPI00272F958C|nr:type II toxin-antitoxin system HicA family toxin [Nitrosomonas sp.]MDP1549472.1 type II toxin-antitoxin system HicA family toxin [Nitrosomonas sp.]